MAFLSFELLTSLALAPQEKRSLRSGNLFVRMLKFVSPCTVSSAGFLLAISPWVTRNFVEFQTFIPATTHGGYTLALGNNPDYYRDVINGDATSEEVLTLAGIQRASVLASVLPDDAANVFITLTARELRPDMEIIARGESPSTQKKLIRSGANRVVLPAAIGAVKIARLITCPTAESLLSGEKAESDFNDELGQIGLRIWEVTIDAGSPLAGHTISQLRAGEASTYMIVAVREPDGTVHTQPEPDHQVNPGDVILVLYRTDKCPQFTLREDAGKQLIYRGARS